MVALSIRERAGKLDREQVVVNLISPAWFKTNLFRIDDGGFGGRIGLRLIGRAGEEGSKTLVYAIVAGARMHEIHVSEGRTKSWSTFVQSAAGQETQKRL